VSSISFDRFDDESRKIVALCRKIANRNGCKYQGVEHMAHAILSITDHRRRTEYDNVDSMPFTEQVRELLTFASSTNNEAITSKYLRLALAHILLLNLVDK